MAVDPFLERVRRLEHNLLHLCRLPDSFFQGPAIQDRDGSEAAYEQARYKSEIQEEAYNLNLKKMEQGLISPLELQTATNNYLKSKADEMNSQFKYLIKDAVVRYYSGVEYVNQ